MLRMLVLLFAMSVVATLNAGNPDLSKIERVIRKEPAYVAQPRYALLVFGPRAEQRSWLVLDGHNVAYVDRNGNGDLTDVEDRVVLDKDATAKIRLGDTSRYTAFNVFPLGDVADTKLIFQLWVPNPDDDFENDKSPEISSFRRLMRDRNCLNGSLMRIATGGMQAQNPLLLAATPNEAQICHMDGPLTFSLKWRDKQLLEPWPKQTVFDVHIGTPGLSPPDFRSVGFNFSPLTTSEVPTELRPVAVFEFPAQAAGTSPQQVEVVLNQRCCGDTFYATWTLPKEVKSGIAKVTVSMPLWVGHDVRPATFEIPVNQGRSRFSEASYVMFRDPAIELKHAVTALRRGGLDVTIRDEILSVSGDDDVSFVVRLNRDAEVAETAIELGRRKAAQEVLRHCDARFEIIPSNIDKALEQKAALSDIEKALSTLVAGAIHRTWEQNGDQ